MRIITPTGKLVKVSRVIPYAEKKDKFNGTIRKNAEVAIDMSVKPTGLKCFLKFQNNSVLESSLYVGNLYPEQVQEIIGALLKDGCFDFSRLKYQKVQNRLTDKQEIDGGKSLPYYDECIVINEFPPFLGGQLMGINDGDDEADCEDDCEADCVICIRYAAYA